MQDVGETVQPCSTAPILPAQTPPDVGGGRKQPKIFYNFNCVSINHEYWLPYTANSACSLKVSVELVEASRILRTVSQTGRVRIYCAIGIWFYVTVELTAPAPSSEATHGIVHQFEVVLLTLTCGGWGERLFCVCQYSVSVDSEQREKGKQGNLGIKRIYKNRRTSYELWKWM